MKDDNTTRERAVDKADRVSMGGHKTKLQLSEKDREALEGYVCRWINDKDGRIDEALNASYVFVHREEARSIGTGAIHQENSDTGNKVSKVVSRTGDPFRAYLMKINKELYDQDQAAKGRKIYETTEGRLNPVGQGGATIEGGYTPG